MTADTTVVVYKREPLPQILTDESILNYCGDEFQRIENVLNRHDEAVQNVSEEVDTNDASADASIASLTSSVAGNTAAISSEASTRASADSALSTLITNLTSTVGTNTAAISTEQTARANADTALATDITNLTATVGTNTASITTEATARANADTALATDITNLTATVGTVSASVTTEAAARAAADNTISARYGVELNANGYVTGFKQINDGSSGTFKILADKFLVVDPSASAGVAGEQVFVIESGAVKMNAAFIKDLTVDNIEGDVNTITYFSSSGSKTFGGTSAGYVELTTVDCAANTAGKAHRPTLNMIFSGRFENDTAEVKVEVATLTGGSPGTYSTIQSLEHFCGGVNGANTTIPVIAAMSSDTTSAVRFRISVKMWGDQGDPNTTSASNTGTAKWRGYTVGLT